MSHSSESDKFITLQMSRNTINGTPTRLRLNTQTWLVKGKIKKKCNHGNMGDMFAGVKISPNIVTDIIHFY